MLNSTDIPKAIWLMTGRTIKVLKCRKSYCNDRSNVITLDAKKCLLNARAWVGGRVQKYVLNSCFVLRCFITIVNVCILFYTSVCDKFLSSDTFRSNSGPCPSLTVFEPIGLGSLKCRIRCKQEWRVLFVWFFFCNVSCKCPPHSVASYAVSKRCGEAVGNN